MNQSLQRQALSVFRAIDPGIAVQTDHVGHKEVSARIPMYLNVAIFC